jgi:ketosteroid isomerase-like protein
MSAALRVFAAAVLLFALSRSSPAGSNALEPADERRVRAVNDAYVSAWRKNDPAAVLATFWPDAVLVPQGRAAIGGYDAIRRFWWPPGPATTVTGFTHTTDEVGGSGSLGFARGSFVLDFEWEEGGRRRNQRNRGNYLMILRRDPAGEWRISHRMWSDLPPASAPAISPTSSAPTPGAGTRRKAGAE